MTLDSYIRPLDPATICHHAGTFLQLLGGVLLVPALAALGFGERREAMLLIPTAVVVAGIGSKPTSSGCGSRRQKP